jgi:hypothetical protein
VSAPLKRRCVAGCDGQSARVSWSEDALNRFEEHRDNDGKLVRLFVHPKGGSPKYEVLVGGSRSRAAHGRARSPYIDPEANMPQLNQSAWEIKKF